jgi:hypothetical protein
MNGSIVAFTSWRLSGEGQPAQHSDVDIGRMSSMAEQDRPVISAAMMVVPEPLNGS